MAGNKGARLDRLQRVLFDAAVPLTAHRCGILLGLPEPRRAVFLLRDLERRGRAERCGLAPNGMALWRWRDGPA
jgi:hypothetical protein